MLDASPIIQAVEREARRRADALGRAATKTRAFTEGGEGGQDVFARWNGRELELPQSGFDAEYRSDGEAWVGDFLGRLGASPT